MTNTMETSQTTAMSYSSIQINVREKIKHLMPPNCLSTLRFLFCFCFCANYLSFQNSSLSQRQMDFSSLLRYKLKAHRKYCEQLQGLRSERPLRGSQTNAVCQISSIYWQGTHAAAGRRGQPLSYCSQRPTTLSESNSLVCTLQGLFLKTFFH